MSRAFLLDSPLCLPAETPYPALVRRRCSNTAFVKDSFGRFHHQDNCKSKGPQLRLSLSSAAPSRRYAVLGAGFAGLSVAWHLLELSPRGSKVSVDIIDEVGIGGGASGVAGGLLHPYSPKGRVLWKGGEAWRECLRLLDIAERSRNCNAAHSFSDELSNHGIQESQKIVWRRGILRPATTLKNAEILKENARNFLESCSIELLDKDAAQRLVPHLCVPFNMAIYMPLAVNIDPKRYLQALFVACKSLASELSELGFEGREISLQQKSINSLLELEGEYDSVIICLGAKVDTLQELSGKLPLRTCRGVIAHMQLPDKEDEYGENSPSILSDAWVAAQGPRRVLVGSTWDWQSRNFLAAVTAEEASKAKEELISKASLAYPAIKKWELIGTTAGVRAMPPLTPLGSIPILGSVDEFVSREPTNRFWLLSGLGARGLLYHGLLGKLVAQAVISSDENILPFELTSWKKRLPKDIG